MPLSVEKDTAQRRVGAVFLFHALRYALVFVVVEGHCGYLIRFLAVTPFVTHNADMAYVVTIGSRWGHLLVTGEAPRHVFKNGRHERRVFCVCDCGKETSKLATSLIAVDASAISLCVKRSKRTV